MSEKTWAEFRQQTFGDPYMVWHDGADFADFRARARADPAEVERQLLAGLAEGDSLAAQAMADGDGHGHGDGDGPGSNEGNPFDEAARARFVTALENALHASIGAFRVAVAEALIGLTGSQQWSDALIDVLVGGGFWGDRLDAAMAIGDLTPTAKLIGALMAGINDPDYLVRYHSSNAMRKFAGKSGDISADSEMFGKILDDTPRAGWKQVAADLSKEAAARLNAT